MARSLSYSLIALLALPLAAQTVDHSYPRVSIFYGTAPAIGDSGLQKVRESVLIGLEASYPIWKGHVSAAVEWREFRSRYHDVTQFSPRNPDGTTVGAVDGDGGVRTGYAVRDGRLTGDRGYITAFGRVGASPYADVGVYPQYNYVRPYGIASDMRFDSVHMSKYDLDGGTSKFSYRQFFKVPFIGEVGVQGGLMLNFLKGTEYTTGSIIVLDWRDVWFQNGNIYLAQGTLNNSANGMNRDWTADNFNPTQGGAARYGRLGGEFWHEGHSEIKIQPGFFVGARAFFNDNFFFETNIAMLSFAEPVYQPMSYTGKDKAYFDTVTKTKIVWEFNAGFRF